MEAKRRSFILTRILPVAFVLLFVAVIAQIFLFVHRKSKPIGGGVIPDNYIAIYCYGNVKKEGPFYFLSSDATIGEIATLSGMNFENDYYEVHSINKLYKITYSDCGVLDNRHVCLLYFPPPNFLSVYSVEEVTLEELLALGLSENAAKRLISYRESVEKIFSKSELLENQVLTQAEYNIVFANLESLPAEVWFLKGEK